MQGLYESLECRVWHNYVLRQSRLLGSGHPQGRRHIRLRRRAFHINQSDVNECERLSLMGQICRRDKQSGQED